MAARSLVARYDNGESVSDLARAYRLTEAEIVKRLRTEGVVVRREAIPVSNESRRCGCGMSLNAGELRCRHCEFCTCPRPMGSGRCYSTLEACRACGRLIERRR